MPNPEIKGPVHAVPCPRCGKPNDFRELAENLKQSSSLGDMAEKGQIVTCDFCDQNMEVAGIFTTTIISVRIPE